MGISRMDILTSVGSTDRTCCAWLAVGRVQQARAILGGIIFGKETDTDQRPRAGRGKSQEVEIAGLRLMRHRINTGIGARASGFESASVFASRDEPQKMLAIFAKEAVVAFALERGCPAGWVQFRASDQPRNISGPPQHFDGRICRSGGEPHRPQERLATKVFIARNTGLTRQDMTQRRSCAVFLGPSAI